MQNIIQKSFIPVLFFFIGFTSIAQTHLYENPNFDQIAKEHKIIAILPFTAKVSLRPKQMKEISAEQLAEMEKSEGTAV